MKITLGAMAFFTAWIMLADWMGGMRTNGLHGYALRLGAFCILALPCVLYAIWRHWRHKNRA